MDEHDRPGADRPPGSDPAPRSAASAEATSAAAPSTVATSVAAGLPATSWVGALPPPPFVDPAAPLDRPRFAAPSPRVFLLIGAAILMFWLLWMARDSVRPFVVGLLLVYLLDPPVRFLVRRGINRVLAITIVYVVAVVAIVEALNLMLTPLVNELLRFVEELPSLVGQFQSQLERLTEVYARLQLPPAVRDWVDALVASIAEGNGVPVVDFSFLLPLVSGAGSVVGSVFGYLLLPVWIFFLLKDRVTLVSQFDRALPSAWRFDVWAVLRITRRVFGQWVRAQVILGLTVGIFTFIGLMILSATVDPVFGRYAILLSVSAGILELLPVIGPIIAAVPAVLLAATAGLEAVVAALVLYTLVQQVENNLLVPKIQGAAVALHPAAVLFALVIGGSIAGLLGAILALPIAAALRDVLRYLFRRLSPESPDAMAASIDGLRLDVHPGIPGVGTGSGRPDGGG